ncbi:TetR/AcrR family transcriptional regulator [Ponticaulis sp.]|uniref:TetR/AcrR family transcriptional regulator n=1 Tax=Ponticaulis sp. TaxID=2020902 RepID=UPI000C93703A|nr:TetR/AcrR family transcriptional regulator [Ponticaulis sp.]MAI90049.1 TetR family transcriptional regulator [Ponticaulis sp.]
MVDDVELNTKTEPSQDRAKNTFEAILSITGDLLVEVGFERLSTNLICKRAGITPPALYRYFPNKYAILKELGDRLMKVQDDVVIKWVDSGGLDTGSLEEEIASNRRMMAGVLDVTKDFPGGAWVLRVMRVIPLLREVQMESRILVADKLYEGMRAKYPNVSDERLQTATLLTTDAGSSAIELAIEEPDRAEAFLDETSVMVATYYHSFLK